MRTAILPKRESGMPLAMVVKHGILPSRANTSAQFAFELMMMRPEKKRTSSLIHVWADPCASWLITWESLRYLNLIVPLCIMPPSPLQSVYKGVHAYRSKYLGPRGDRGVSCQLIVSSTLRNEDELSDSTHSTGMLPGYLWELISDALSA